MKELDNLFLSADVLDIPGDNLDSGSSQSLDDASLTISSASQKGSVKLSQLDGGSESTLMSSWSELPFVKDRLSVSSCYNITKELVTLLSLSHLLHEIEH